MPIVNAYDDCDTMISSTTVRTDMHPIITCSMVVLLSITHPVAAIDYYKDQVEVQKLLNGKRLEGVYLRTQSPYSLDFHRDGRLINQRGAEGSWWVNEQGQYCREWKSGRLAGNKACLDLAPDGDKTAIYSKGKKVAVGSLLDR